MKSVTTPNVSRNVSAQATAQDKLCTSCAVKRISAIRPFLLFVIPLALSLLFYFGISSHNTVIWGLRSVHILTFISTPILAICFERSFSKTEKLSFRTSIISAVFSIISVIFTIILITLTFTDVNRFTSEFLKASCSIVILLNVLSLIVHAICKKQRTALLLQSTAWLSISYALTFKCTLSYFSDMQNIAHTLKLSSILILSGLLILNFFTLIFSKKRI